MDGGGWTYNVGMVANAGSNKHLASKIEYELILGGAGAQNKNQLE